MQDHIEDSFDTMDKFKEEFVDAGMKRFGSGWVYLVLENGDLKFKTYPNADNKPNAPDGDNKGCLLYTSPSPRDRG